MQWLYFILIEVTCLITQCHLCDKHILFVTKYCLFFNSDSKPFFDESFREEYMKPGFENFADAATAKPSADVDLDGEIYGKFTFETLMNKVCVNHRYRAWNCVKSFISSRSIAYFATTYFTRVREHACKDIAINYR